MVQCLDGVNCKTPVWNDFNLSHGAESSQFSTSQFGPPWITTAWNGIWFIYFGVTLVLDIVCYNSDHMGVWFVYVSNLTYLLVTITTMVELGVRSWLHIRQHNNPKEDGSPLRWYMQIQWLLFNTSNTIMVLNTCIGLVLYSPECVGIHSYVNKFLLTTIYVIAHVFITREPIKIFHFYLPMIFVVLCVIVSTIIQKSNRELDFSRKILFDWDNPLKTVLIVICVLIFIIPLIHMMFYGLYKLRLYLHLKYCKRKGSSSNNTNAVQTITNEQTTLKRDITATDVVLEDETNYLEIRVETRDDNNVKFSSERERCDVVLPISASRLFKSESDLKDYRTKNGMFCDFTTRSNNIGIHKQSKSFTEGVKIGEYNPKYCKSKRDSQIIVVRKCTDDDVISDISSESDLSEFQSENITDDILASL